MPTHPLKLKNPIVLVHGLGATGKIGPVDYFFGIEPLLRSAGNEVISVSLSPLQNKAVRAAELKQLLLEKIKGDSKIRFNLIGHSFGGLDAKAIALDPELTGHIASVTTIGTPHRGTVVADLLLGLLPLTGVKLADQMLSLARSSVQGYAEMSTHQNPMPHHPSVAYFSATTVIRKPIVRYSLPIFWIPHRLIERHEGENDGFVSEHSAKDGTHLQTQFGDHYAQIGHFLGRTRGLDHVEFFKNIVISLKKQGF